MRHIAVRRIAVLLGALFLVWAAVFAWIVRREPAAEPLPVSPTTVSGAVLFERHCASCHPLDPMRAAVGGEPGGTRRSELEQFLDGHGEASTEDDRRILDYLEKSRQVEK